ncbi:MAG: AEC family transporter [Arenicella sp.]
MLPVISIIFPIFFIVLCGYIYACFEKPDMQVINRMILQLLVPALVFSVMSSKDFEIAIYSKLALAGVGVILASGLAAYFVAKLCHFQWKTLVPPMMFRNWGNLGIPLIVFAFGEQALNAAVILFLVGNVVHFSIGVILMSGRFNVREFFQTPVIIAMLLGLLVNIADIQMPVFLLRPLDMIGQAAIPLMLVSLGVRLQHVRWSDLSMAFVGAVLGPIIGLTIAFVLASLLGMSDLQTKQIMIFGALPPAVVNYMFAERYNLEPEKVASIVLLSNLVSIGVYFVLLYFII